MTNVIHRDGGEDFAASAGEYELEDGRRIVLDGGGVIRYIFAAPGEEVAAAEASLIVAVPQNIYGTFVPTGAP